MNLKLIYWNINRMENCHLPLGLKDGKVGVLLFCALYSELLQQSRLRNRCHQLLVEVIEDIPSMQGKLFSGSWGVLWTLQLLIDKKILEKDEALDMVIQPIKNNCQFWYADAPIRIVEEDNLFSEGICTYCQWNKEDTLERYSTEERLIGLVDECERLLTSNISDIYVPEKDMTVSLLHSIIHFLTMLKQHDIYPYRAEQLLKEVTNFQCIQKGTLADRYILSSLLSEKDILFPIREDDATLYDFLAEVGFYSLLYDSPTLFYAAYHHLEEVKTDFEKKMLFLMNRNFNLTNLLGWGYGILQCKLNSYV